MGTEWGNLLSQTFHFPRLKGKYKWDFWCKDDGLRLKEHLLIDESNGHVARNTSAPYSTWDKKRKAKRCVFQTFFRQIKDWRLIYYHTFRKAEIQVNM
ncbi:unnamed protein product [Caretta caretta]